MHGPALDPLAQTMLLPLWGRARYARFDAARTDPSAESLLAALGVDTAALERSMGSYGVLAFGRRAAWIDDRARRWLQAHPGGALVNLGAGLDALLERVDDGQARCTSVDRPPVIALRRAQLGAPARERLVEAQLEEPAATDAIPTDAPAFVVLAGVSMYLPKPALLDLVGRIGARLAPGSELVFDAYSPAGARITNALIRLTGLTEPGVHAGGDDVRALRAAAPTLVLAEARDLFAEPTPAGVGAWTHLQVALSRWVRFTTLYAYTVPPCPPPTS